MQLGWGGGLHTERYNETNQTSAKSRPYPEVDKVEFTMCIRFKGELLKK